MFQAGDCFLIETNRDEGGFIKSHLHIVIIDCEEHTGTTVIVVVETLEGKKDETTILKPGDHDFIQQDSYVNYRRSRTTSNTDLRRLVETGVAKPKNPVSKELLIKIKKGIIDSRFTPRYVVEYCRRKFSDEAFDQLK